MHLMHNCNGKKEGLLNFQLWEAMESVPLHVVYYTTHFIQCFSSSENYFLADLKKRVAFPGTLKINVKARLCINVFITDYFMFS